MTSDITFERKGEWGVVTLDRPDALNALTLPMAAAFRRQLMDWDGGNRVRAVMVRGAGGKAFCAGGDIRWLYEEAKKDPARACDFFREEYRNNAAIHRFTKPYVALIDGIVMGGGVGISVHGDFRLAGDRTLFAMPETGIGLFPDVGGGYFLPRLNNGVGLYLALTGARLKAADCMAANIATHYIPSADRAAVEDALLGLSFGGHAHADIEALLDEASADPGHAPLNDIRPEIEKYFLAPPSLDALVAALERDDGDFAKHTLSTLSKMSPTSLKITFEQMKRGHGKDFDDVMRMEFRIVRRIVEKHDFFEGVRALIIDKDKNPKWNPASLADVDDAEIETYFAPLGAEELTLP